MRQIRKQSRPRVRSDSGEANASETTCDRSVLRRAEALVDLITQVTG